MRLLLDRRLQLSLLNCFWLIAYMTISKVVLKRQNIFAVVYKCFFGILLSTVNVSPSFHKFSLDRDGTLEEKTLFWNTLWYTLEYFRVLLKVSIAARYILDFSAFSVHLLKLCIRSVVGFLLVHARPKMHCTATSLAVITIISKISLSCHQTS